jgi:glycosyltransferase involved in cell wall biosynthesis
MPQVSVIIPAYNAMAFLPETLESVLNQTFTDFEVLIINDGSPDDIVEWASEIKDSRVKLISQENQGISGARNTGMWSSQGEYLAFLDADDIWEAKKLEKQVEYLEKHPDVGLVSSWISNVDRNGNFIDLYDCSEGGKDLTKALFRSNIFIVVVLP